MLSTRAFKQEQRSVAFAMAAALVASIVVLGVVGWAGRAAAPMPFVSRLQFALRADTFVVVWLVAGIANVARLRFFSTRDIAGSSAGDVSEDVRMANAVLQNTVEQVVLATVTHMIVVAAFVRSNAVIAALVCLFAAGRLLFWAGYRRGAKGRAFGFALTFYPSALALLASTIAALPGWAE
jgi:uncharacterized membrane protein YecN with MAPEG domain